MNSIWYSLAWKEWHEHKWKLVSMVAVLWGAAGLTLALFSASDIVAVAIAMVGMCMLPLAMFVGLGAAASERARNTLPFLQSLPAPLWRLAVVKIVFGLLSVLAAIILAIAFIGAWAYVARLAGHAQSAMSIQMGNGSITGIWYVDCFILVAPFAASLFLWAAAAGVNRRDEVSAGFVAVAAVVGWATLLVIGYTVLARWFIQFDHPYYYDKWRWLGVVAFSTLPGGTFPAQEISAEKPPLSMAYCYTSVAITYLLLIGWYVFRFGKLRKLEIRSPQAAARQSARAEWLAAPRLSPAISIIWKQLRESLPIALAGLAGSIGTTLIVVLVDYLDRDHPATVAVAEVFPKMAIVFGFFVALVAGVGVCINDVTPKANEFWRSRPIHPDAWFWIKFATGIVVVLVSIYGPILLLSYAGLPGVFESWNFLDAFTIPAMHFATYAAAVATACLVRQAVYAAILSIAVTYLGVLFGIFLCTFPKWLQSDQPAQRFLTNPTTPQLLFGLATSAVISTALAWLAMRYDWGKKSRY